VADGIDTAAYNLTGVAPILATWYACPVPDPSIIPMARCASFPYTSMAGYHRRVSNGQVGRKRLMYRRRFPRRPEIGFRYRPRPHPTPETSCTIGEPAQWPVFFVLRFHQVSDPLDFVTGWAPAAAAAAAALIASAAAALIAAASMAAALIAAASIAAALIASMAAALIASMAAALIASIAAALIA
jgi:hypothetical protein